MYFTRNILTGLPLYNNLALFISNTSTDAETNPFGKSITAT